MDLPGDPKLWPDDPLNRGLVGEWRFDRDTGRMVPDRSGLRIAGITVNTVWQTSEYGPCLYFDGTAHVDGESNLPISGIDPFTIEAFAAPDDTGDVFGNIFKYTLVALGTWTAQGEGTRICLMEDGIRWATFNRANIDYAFPAPAPGEPFHIVAAHDGTGSRNLYINGVNRGSAVDALALVESPLKVGWHGSDLEFEGIVYTTRIYNRPLSTPEAAARYQICTARASGAKSLWMIPFIIEDVGIVTYTVTAAAQAVLKMAATATAAGQAVLKEAYSKTSAGQAWVQDRTTNTAAGQAILKELYSKTAAGQAWLQDRVTSTAAGQAFLQMTATATAAGQAVLKMSASATAAGQAVLKEAYSKTAAGQAYLVDIAADKAAAMKAILKEAYSKSTAAQAWIQDRIITSAAGQAVLKEAVGATNALQAYLIDIGVGTGIAAMKAVLKEAYSKSAAAQAILKMAASATSAIQAYLQDRSTLGAAIRAIIKGTMTPIAAMQAYLSGAVVKVDFTLEPRPTVLKVGQRPTTLEVEPRPDILYIEER